MNHLPFDSLLELAAIVAGAYGILHQIRKDNEASDRRQREQFKQQVHLDLYRELRFKLRRTVEATAVVDTTIRLVPGSLENYWRTKLDDLVDPAIPPYRAQTILSENRIAFDSILELTSCLHGYSVAVPAFGTFARVLSDTAGEVQARFQKFFSEVLLFLPVELVSVAPDGQPRTYPHLTQPKNGALEAVRKASQAYEKCASDLTCYLYDVDIESQNLLLGALFGAALPIRKPRDRNLVVLDSRPETLRAFEESLAKKNEKKLTELFSEYELERFELLRRLEENR